MVRKLILVAVVLLAGCSQSLTTQGRKFVEQGEYDRAIEAFYSEIARNPQSVDAWRELGIAYYEQGNLEKAEDALKQANGIKPDARANTYMGLIYEKQQMYDPAITAYGIALSLDPGGKTEKLIRIHLDQLVIKNIEQEVAQALTDEASIDVARIAPTTIAVVDFDGSHLPADLAPVARGLAEFTAADLGKVNSLDVVDRMKIDVILNELKLSESGAVDQSSAPRLGRLLGSYRLVTGSVLELGAEGIRMDGAIVTTTDSSIAIADPAEGQLANIFKVQKDFVFNIIDELGITLTAEERDAISEVPTESYLAFLAYCRGRDYQRRGFHRDAQAAFQQAQSEDAGFTEAGAAGDMVADGLEFGGGEYSFDGFEGSLTQEMDIPDLGADLGARLSSIPGALGVDPSAVVRRLTEEPPRIDGKTTVIIRGDIGGGNTDAN
jgi:tetratricopeptide (TPR) repeat protein